MLRIVELGKASAMTESPECISARREAIAVGTYYGVRPV